MDSFFESGVRVFPMVGGDLCFHPGDPGVLTRFMELGQRIARLQPEGDDAATQWQQADANCRELLNWVFPGNDFKLLLGQVNVLSVCPDGKTVLEKFLEAVAQILREGMRAFAQQLAQVHLQAEAQ